MIFRHQALNKQLEWKPSQHLCELVMESPTFLRQLLRDLTVEDPSRQISVTERGESLHLEKDIDVILNPVKLDFNNRRAMTTLLKLLVKASLSEDFYLSTNSLKSKIIKYLDSVVGAEDFEFEVSTNDFMIDSLAKAANLHIVGDEDDFVELITDYMAMMADLTGTKLFVFFNLRSLITKKELKRLHHNLDNHQIDVLLVENLDRGALEGVSRVVVDEDTCEI